MTYTVEPLNKLKDTLGTRKIQLFCPLLMGYFLSLEILNVESIIYYVL